MKKVMVFFLLLLVACMGFAAEKSLQVTLTINKLPLGLAFTLDAYTDPAKELPAMNGPVNLGTVSEIPSSEKKELTSNFWASARTNSANPLIIKIYGSALTRKTEAGFTSDTIPLVLSIETNEQNSSANSGTVTFDSACTSSDAKPESENYLPLVENATSNEDTSGKAGKGARALTWKLKIAATIEAGKLPTAGNYESYIWLVVDPEP